MAKGIIYTMTTVVPGLIKIGKTGEQSFEQRMYNLEHNGYSNVVGLKRHFAILVDNYDEKESLLDTIFSKSQVPGTELFALDIDLVVQLLSSFDGTVVYPREETKEEVFDTAADHRGTTLIPNGTYYLDIAVKGEKGKRIKATMRKDIDGYFICKGSEIAPDQPNTNLLSSAWKDIRSKMCLESGILQTDVPCVSPSMASSIILGHISNGWVMWRDSNKQLIDVYRREQPPVEDVE